MLSSILCSTGRYAWQRTDMHISDCHGLDPGTAQFRGFRVSPEVTMNKPIERSHNRDNSDTQANKPDTKGNAKPTGTNAGQAARKPSKGDGPSPSQNPKKS